MGTLNISEFRLPYQWSLKQIDQPSSEGVAEQTRKKAATLIKAMGTIDLRGKPSLGYLTQPTPEYHAWKAIHDAREILKGVKVKPSIYKLRVWTNAFNGVEMTTLAEETTYHVKPSYRVLKEDITQRKSRLRSRIRSLRASNREFTIEGVRSAAGHFVRVFNRKKYASLYDSKNPDDARTHIAVEMECLSKLEHADLAVIIVDTCGTDVARYVTIKGDGSLRSIPDSNFDVPTELVVCCPRDQFEKVIQKLCAAIAPHVRVNKTCGLHVHFDMRNRSLFYNDEERAQGVGYGFDSPKSEAAYKRLYLAQSILINMQPVSRRNNGYCKRNNTSNAFDARRNGNRYKVINMQALSRHRTIEVRVHSGTVDAVKILSWIRILEHIMAMPNEALPQRAISSLKRLGLPQDLHDYAASRIALFKNQVPSESNEQTE